MRDSQSVDIITFCVFAPLPVCCSLCWLRCRGFAAPYAGPIRSVIRSGSAAQFPDSNNAVLVHGDGAALHSTAEFPATPPLTPTPAVRGGRRGASLLPSLTGPHRVTQARRTQQPRRADLCDVLCAVVPPAWRPAEECDGIMPCCMTFVKTTSVAARRGEIAMSVNTSRLDALRENACVLVTQCASSVT